MDNLWWTPFSCWFRLFWYLRSHLMPSSWVTPSSRSSSDGRGRATCATSPSRTSVAPVEVSKYRIERRWRENSFQYDTVIYRLSLSFSMQIHLPSDVRTQGTQMSFLSHAYFCRGNKKSLAGNEEPPAVYLRTLHSTPPCLIDRWSRVHDS